MPTPWLQLPVAFVGARWESRGAAVTGVVVVCVLVAAIVGVRVAWARSADPETIIAPGGGSRAGPSTSALSTGSGPASPSPTAAAPAPTDSAGGAVVGEVVVHVVGQVTSPGVLRLASGSRVSDAVAAAGGPTATADLARINLARMLVDGEQVRVPTPGEEVVEPPPAAAGVGTGPGGGAGGSGGPGGQVSLNTTDLAGLDTLPGVGPVLAGRILDWRREHGRFATVDELAEVSGIGEKLLEQLRPLVTV